MGCNKLIDLHGMRYGRLQVIEIAGKKGCETTWLCKCDCGNETVVMGGNLRSGKTKSCGCFHDESSKKRFVKHNLTGTRLNRIWKNMKTRCSNPNSNNYQYYGERGITICEEWKNSFESFMEWALANGYREDLTIDRIDVNENYEPNNCRWVTMTVQNNNRRILGGKIYG